MTDRPPPNCDGDSHAQRGLGTTAINQERETSCRDNLQLFNLPPSYLPTYTTYYNTVIAKVVFGKKGTPLATAL